MNSVWKQSTAYGSIFSGDGAERIYWLHGEGCPYTIVKDIVDNYYVCADQGNNDYSSAWKDTPRMLAGPFDTLAAAKTAYMVIAL